MPYWRASNVCRRRYLAGEAALHFAKHVFGSLLQRAGRALTITQLNGNDQPVMQTPELETHFASGRDRRPLEIGAHRRSQMLRKIEQRLFRTSSRPCFSYKRIVDQSIYLLKAFQMLALHAGGHFYSPQFNN